MARVIVRAQPQDLVPAWGLGVTGETMGVTGFTEFLTQFLGVPHLCRADEDREGIRPP